MAQKMNTHKFPLGSIVKTNVNLSQSDTDIEINLFGPCQLYIVGYLAGGSGEPLYILSDLPVLYPMSSAHPPSANAWTLRSLLYRNLATLLEYCFESDVQPTGSQRVLYPTLADWYQTEYTA